MAYGQGDYSPEDDAPRSRLHPERRLGEILDGRRDRLWKAAETLDNAVDTLTHRIAPVLLPERPAAALGAVGQEHAEVSDLAMFLENVIDKLEAVGRRISETSERVDL